MPQCVVTVRPSSMPAAANANAPVQIEAIRMPARAANFRAAVARGLGGRRWSRYPGTTIVSAPAKTSSPSRDPMVKPSAETTESVVDSTSPQTVSS